MIPHFNALRSLNVFGSYRIITDGAVVALAQHCTLLQELDLSWCNGVTDSSINEIAKKGKELVSLNVRSCKDVTTDSLTNLVRNCPKMRCLLFDIYRNAVFAVQIRNSYLQIRFVDM